MRRVKRQVDRADRELVRRSAALPPSVADPGLRLLGTAANHSVLWFTVAALLASRKGVTRRGALRGVVAIAGASFTANAVAKPLLPRRRPPYDNLPPQRRPDRDERPDSSSFPSGHAASAAAFTTAVAMESPLAGAALAPVAAAVAYSRVHTGVHWPSDVVGGAVLGGAVALATRRWWPVRPDDPAQSRHVAEAPRPDRGEGLTVLVNPGSGVNWEHPGERISATWPAARLVFPKPDADLAHQLGEVLDGSPAPVRALGVAGGDGTVAAVASVAAHRDLPLAVLPAGTLNHFARDVGIGGIDSLAAAVRDGTAVAVDLGTVRVDGDPPRWFVNTASLGGYPDLVRLRERWQPRWGKWPAAAAALVRVMHASRPLVIRVDGRVRPVWLLFVGNGSYRPRGFAASARPRLDSGLLDVRYVRADVVLSRTRFVLAAVSGALLRSRTYVQTDRAELDVEVLGDPVAVATDGEIGPTGRRFRFTSHAAALDVYRAAG